MWFRWFWAIVRFWPSDPIWRPWVKHWSCSKLFGKHIVLFLTFTLLPPANEVCEGYVFTRVCLSTGGGSTWAGTPLLGRYTPGQVPPRAGTPSGQVHPLGRYTPTTVHAGIRSISGRYASHWNAFLFVGFFCSGSLCFRICSFFSGNICSI